MPKMRLDLLLVERGLAESRAKAQALIMAGEVRVQGEVELKPSTSVEAGARLEVEHGPRFVSRGGEKLDAALEAFGIPISGRICADVGASTGGFTDCLLQRGAAKVYAIDVGKGILHWKLRNDPRVIVMEDTNARYVEWLPERASLITIDASFISLKILLPVVKAWLVPPASARTSPTCPSGAPSQNADQPDIAASTTNSGSIERSSIDKGHLGREGVGLHVGEQGRGREAGVGDGDVIALIKPQFEAGRQDVARGDGVIRDPFVHQQVLTSVLAFASSHGLGVRGLLRSPLLGPKGNAEFLAWLVEGESSGDIPAFIEAAIQKPDAQA